MNLFRKKTIKDAIEQTTLEGHDLKRSLSAKNLAFMTISVAIGGGIFSVSARQAAFTAGPSVTIGFIIAAAVCAFAILCYAEFASSVPVAGSSYTFSYMVMGEFVAFLIGWGVILESLLVTAVIAKYWTVYLTSLLSIANPTIHFGIFNFEIITIFMLIGIAVLLMCGTKLTATVASVATVIKISVILFLIVVGVFYISKSNLTPFIPPSVPVEQAQSSIMENSLLATIFNMGKTNFGFWGIITSASVLFFAFVGIDLVASTAEETKKPKRDLPLGLLSGLGITVALYVAVSLVVTGMVKYSDMAAYALKNNLTPNLSMAFEMRGVHWAGSIINLGATLGLTTVAIVCLLALSRIVFAIARDGLFPKWLSKTSKKFKTPFRLQIILLLLLIAVISIFDVQNLEEMVNIGTLLAFAIVSFSLIKSRRDKTFTPEFRVPFSPVLPAISGIACIWMVLNLSVLTWVRFAIWFIIGLVLYFGYSYRHSNLKDKK